MMRMIQQEGETDYCRWEHWSKKVSKTLIKEKRMVPKHSGQFG